MTRLIYPHFSIDSLVRLKKLSLNNKIFKKVPPQDYLNGTIVRRHIISKFLKYEREIDIYLPPAYYKDRDRRFPVLYMHDGNNLFYPSISFAGVPWRVDSTMDMLISNGLIEETIVVGIHNTPQRNYEYTWTQMKHPNGQVEGGGGKWYAKFITEELKPRFDKNFKTLTDRKNTGIMGSSLGGLISFYLGLNFPDVFSKIGVVSPSLWWDKGIAFTDVEKIRTDLDIWLDMGTREGYYENPETNMNILSTRFMKLRLIEHGYREGINLAYLEDKGAQHNEYSWGKRLHLPLLFFFGKNKNLLFERNGKPIF